MTGDNRDSDDDREQVPSERDTSTTETAAATTVQDRVGDGLADGGFEAGFFNAVVEKVGVGVGVYGENGRFAYVNEAYADLLEMDRESLHGSALWEVNPAIDEQRFGAYWRSFDIGETRQREAVHACCDGSEIPVETHTTAVEVDNTRYNVGTITGISERVEGWEKLERQDERLEQFASVVSHDLRNPLNVAMGRLQLAQETAESEHLDHVEQSLHRIEALIQDVLTMARDGNRIKEPEPVALEAIVARAWQQIGAEDATFVTENELGTVQSDENRLLEVFENLFDNAVSHGGPGVTIKMGRTDDGVYVTDDGPGIPPSEREDVLDYGYTTDEHGTGFGLTIVEQIATAHGWSVSLSESDDGGVRVEIADIDFE
jgi:PAS domain S-box-containing protein